MVLHDRKGKRTTAYKLGHHRLDRLLDYLVAVKLTLVSALSGMVAKSATGTFLLVQVPALCAIGAAFLIRKKLLSNAAEKDAD